MNIKTMSIWKLLFTMNKYLKMWRLWNKQTFIKITLFGVKLPGEGWYTVNQSANQPTNQPTYVVSVNQCLDYKTNLWKLTRSSMEQLKARILSLILLLVQPLLPWGRHLSASKIGVLFNL